MLLSAARALSQGSENLMPYPGLTTGTYQRWIAAAQSLTFLSERLRLLTPQSNSSFDSNDDVDENLHC